MNNSGVPYKLIRVEGPDAVDFLDSQLTRRVGDLADNETRLAAWCNAKGRVQALFRIHRSAGGFVLQFPESLASRTLPRLKMFVLRSRVNLVEAEPRPVANQDVSRLDEIQAGIPEIYPETTEQFLPQMLNLDQLGAIDFKKGCYPGQEIVARTQYRGQVKRRMRTLVADHGKTPAAGATLSASGGSEGIVVDAATDDNGRLFVQAVIPLDAMHESWRLDNSDAPLKTLSAA